MSARTQAVGEKPNETTQVSSKDSKLNLTEFLSDPRMENAQLHSEASSEMGKRIDATSQAVAAADRAYVTDEIGSVRWEWRGLLKRTARRRRPRTS